MSIIHFNTLVQAVVDYMAGNYPTTPEDFNFQAELKAASHWRWFSGNELPNPISGPHDDFRIIIAAIEALRKWKRDLEEAKQHQATEREPPCAEKVQSDDEEGDSSSENLDEYISGLEEDIFNLTMYYGKYIKELDCDEATGMCQSSSGIGKHFPKKEAQEPKKARNGYSFQDEKNEEIMNCDLI